MCVSVQLDGSSYTVCATFLLVQSDAISRSRHGSRKFESQTQIEYLIDARPRHNVKWHLLVGGIYVQFDDKTKLLDDPRDVQLIV